MINLAIHLGLGDAIIMAPAAIWLSEKHGGAAIGFPCVQKNEKNIRSFFVNHPEIQVRVVDEGGMLSLSNLLTCGYYGRYPVQEGESFDQWFYRGLGVPYEVRWTHCPIRKAAESVVQHLGHHHFLHEDPSRGYQIRGSYLPTDYIECLACKGDILANRDAIESAAEVHVIPSCFKELASALQPKGKLFLHWYARPLRKPFDMTQSRYQWEIIE